MFVLHQSLLSPYSHPVRIVSNTLVQGKVKGGTCDCVAGKGEACSHIAALLFAIDDFVSKGLKELPADQTGIEKLCTWNRQARRKIEPKKIHDIRIVKFGALKQLCDALTSANPTCGFMKYHKIILTDKIEPESLDPLHTVRNFNDFTLPPSIKEIREAGLYFKSTLKLDQNGINELEFSTRSQSNSSAWHSARRFRITASTFHKIGFRRKKLDPTCLLKTLLYNVRKPTKDMLFGLQQDEPSITRFVQELEKRGKMGLNVQKRGLILHPEKCYLGASVDGVVQMDGETYVLELKNPPSTWKMNLLDAAKKLACLKIDENNKVYLNPKHEYFTQIQGQMAVTRIGKCYFVLCTEKNIHTEVVQFDEQFWRICYSCIRKYPVSQDIKQALITDIGKFNDSSERLLTTETGISNAEESDNLAFTDSECDFPLSSQSTQTFSQTTTSDWEEENMAPREIFNAAMKMLSRNFPALNSQLQLPWTSLSKSSSSYYTKIITEAIQLIAQYVAPGQENNLLTDVCKKWISLKEDKPDTMTEALIASYQQQNNRLSQMQILSLFANKHTKERLMELVPGLSVFKIDAARRHATLTFPGQLINPPKVYRSRLSMPRVMHFIEFISCPTYHQAVGYGSKTLKLSSGLEITIPKVVRNVIASRLVSSYTQYCNDEGYECLGRSTLFNIVKACAASQKKNMHGLDNITSEGMRAIDILRKIVSKLEMFGLSSECVVKLKSLLDHVNQHLKFEMKGHVENKSKCAEHCSTYSLSDPTSKCFSDKCDHDPDQSCDDCSTTGVLVLKAPCVPEGTCPKGFKLLSNQTSSANCYYLSGLNAVSWNTAKDNCASTDGAYLWRPNTAQEANAVQNEFNIRKLRKYY
ncbi:Hypothetical predicted protein [Mytilus galloprovincialis]|uniref:SWIM-type domain-containing protein n=1 Tax=Mytilus galloprovincialis TaxID=29158 RepID=A0A8B6C0M9_MYTGA|nr:Hypothetical predicted protein [Mytilus galloprovincialis]